MLICNAAVFGLPHAYTEDGFERTFQVNHLSHFYLIHLMRDKLMTSAPSRLVVVSCESHHFSRLRVGNLSENILNPSAKNCEAIHAYNDSKLCNVSLAHQFHQDYRNYGVDAYAAHPGSMVSGSQLGRAHWAYRTMFAVCRPFAKSLVIDFKLLLNCFFINCIIINSVHSNRQLQPQSIAHVHAMFNSLVAPIGTIVTSARRIRWPVTTSFL